MRRAVQFLICSRRVFWRPVQILQKQGNPPQNMANCRSGEYSYCLRWSSTGLARIFLCQELTLINSPSSSRVRPVGFWVCLTCFQEAPYHVLRYCIRHHALYLGIDRDAIADDGLCAIGSAKKGRAGGSEKDYAIYALFYVGIGDISGLRHRYGAGKTGWTRD